MQIRHGGTTLLEAVLALAMLTGLLIAVSGLLPRGASQIRGGAYASRALAVARTVVEQLEMRSHAWLLEQLCDDPTASTCEVVSGHPAVAAWNELAGGALPEPKIEVRLDAVGSTSVAEATALRLSVRVEWSDASRFRSVRLSTLRT